MPELLALLLGYLLGSFPSAVLIARLRGRDIYALGSGNMGAMNTARNLGLAWGVLVLLSDVGKAALAVGLARWLFPERLAPALVAGVGAVAGHAWPLFTGFRGGKALASVLGAALPLYPLAGLAGLGLIILLSLALWRRPVLATVLTILLYPFLVLAVTRWQGAAQPGAIFLSVLAMAAVAFVKHLPGLQLELRQRPE